MDEDEFLEAGAQVQFWHPEQVQNLKAPPYRAASTFYNNFVMLLKNDPVFFRHGMVQHFGSSSNHLQFSFQVNKILFLCWQ